MKFSKYLKRNNNKVFLVPVAVLLLSLGGVFAYYNHQVANTSNVYTWEIVNDKATWDTRSDACSMEFKDRLWIYGGNRTNPNPTKYDVYLLTPGFLNQPMRDIWNTTDGSSWEKKASDSLPEGFGCQLIGHDDMLWSFGAGVWSSADGHNWKRVSEKLPIGNFSVSVFKNKFWLLGGSDADIFKREVWSSENGIDWKQVTSHAPWPARVAHSYATTVHEGKLWLVGGMIDDPNEPGRIISTNDVWSTSNGRDWTEAKSDDSWPGASGHVVFTYGDYMWIFGGYRNNPSGHKINELWRSKDGISWEMMEVKNEKWYPRDDYAFTVYDDKMWVIGGHKHRTEEPKYGDVWRAKLPR